MRELLNSLSSGQQEPRLLQLPFEVLCLPPLPPHAASTAVCLAALVHRPRKLISVGYQVTGQSDTLTEQSARAATGQARPRILYNCGPGSDVFPLLSCLRNASYVRESGTM